MVIEFLNNLLALLLEAAPWLVFGLALGGLIKALIPTSFLQRHLSGNNVASIGKAALLGAPLPLCSCGVIPVALGLRKAGASKPATTSFLVSTPETGIDSITVTYALLGPFMAIVRPIAALASALVSGLLVILFDRDDPKASDNPTHNKTTTNRACCASEIQPTNTVSTESPLSGSSCCGSESSNKTTQQPSWVNQGWQGVHYAFTSLLDDIILWLMVGMAFAALANTFLPADFLAQWGQGIPAMLIIMLAGIPMYICATASTPVAAGLMMAGVSPGVALVLMLTGPATNISTLGVIQKEMGTKTMALYLLGVCATALIAGLIVNGIVSGYEINITAELGEHGHTYAWLQWGALLLLAVVSLRRFFRYSTG